MSQAPPDESARYSFFGVIYGASAFIIWGLSPIYWKALGSVPSLEIVLHRVIWSFFFLMILIALRKRWVETLAVFKNIRTLTTLVLTSMLVSCNWLVYIWAVNSNYLLQASLGYYINPLVNVLLGTLFLEERLRPYQLLAVMLAASGVGYLTIFYGQFPWIALALAFSFGFYGLIRKVTPAGALVGLTIETLLLMAPSLIYLVYLDRIGSGTFLSGRIEIDFLLAGTSVITALPLLFFNLGARMIRLSTVGFLQYITPSCMFLMAVFLFGEPFAKAQLISFILIWTALAIYTTDSVIFYRKAGV
jgi:chloramphenicol-sensitive protein RarD